MGKIKYISNKELSENESLYMDNYGLLLKSNKINEYYSIQLWYSGENERLIRDNYLPAENGYYIYVEMDGVGFFTESVYKDLADACESYKKIWSTMSL